MGNIDNYVKIIKSIDLFGESPKLLIKRKPKFGTLLGGLTSLLMIIIFILSIPYFARDLWSKSRLNIIKSTVNFPDFGQMNFNLNEFFFLFGLYNNKNSSFITQNSGVFISQALNVFNNHKSSETVNITTSIPIETSSCNNYFNNSRSLSKLLNGYNIDLMSLTCIKPGVSILKSFPINKIQSEYVYLNIRISKCSKNNYHTNNNYTKPDNNINNNCNTSLTDETIDSILYDSSLIILVIQNNIDFNSNSNSLKQNIEDYWVPISPMNTIKTDFFIENIKYSFNTGFFSDNYDDIFSIYKVRETKSLNLENRREHELLANIKFQGQRTGKKYFLYSTRIPEVLSFIGGFLKLILIAAKAFSNFFSKIEYTIYLISLYNNSHQVYLETKISPNNIIEIKNNPRKTIQYAQNTPLEEKKSSNFTIKDNINIRDDKEENHINTAKKIRSNNFINNDESIEIGSDKFRENINDLKQNEKIKDKSNNESNKDTLTNMLQLNFRSSFALKKAKRINNPLEEGNFQKYKSIPALKIIKEIITMI